MLATSLRLSTHRRGLVGLALGIMLVASGCDSRTPAVSECHPEGECDTIDLEPTDKVFSALDGDSSQGVDLWTTACASCHGKDGIGVGAGKGLNFTAPAWHGRSTDEKIRLVILNGRGSRMPAFKFDDTQLKDLIAFVRTLESKGGAPASKY